MATRERNAPPPAPVPPPAQNNPSPKRATVQSGVLGQGRSPANVGGNKQSAGGKDVGKLQGIEARLARKRSHPPFVAASATVVAAAAAPSVEESRAPKKTNTRSIPLQVVPARVFSAQTTSSQKGETHPWKGKLASRGALSSDASSTAHALHLGIVEDHEVIEGMSTI